MNDNTIRPLLDQLIGYIVDAPDSDRVLEWASPVPVFGDLKTARIATVGINPSNREFVDRSGEELVGRARRLTTLTSLGLPDWTHATDTHLTDILDSCRSYFHTNPYRSWFDVLDRALREGGFSYYDDTACHLDLVALATRDKWAALATPTRRRLTAQGRDVLAQLIRDSNVDALLLNGRSVVDAFAALTDIDLHTEHVDDWALPRPAGHPVAGYRFSGILDAVGGIDLGRQVTVYGYNHNLQSSFGVTNTVIDRIGKRLGDIVAATAHS